VSDAKEAIDVELTALVGQLAAHLREQGKVLATAESCTGGWIGKVLTDLPGSSDWYAGGVISYSNQAKRDILGVPASILDEHGAVSEPVVLAMARGAREVTGADAAIAVSGVAGPGGGTAEKPVGLVWFAWSLGERDWAKKVQFDGDREAIRRQAVELGIRTLLFALSA
jgi:nicotinamide-nucleotide amidase